MNRLKYLFVAVLALFAVAAIAGYPVISPDVLAGIGALGAMPMMIGDTTVKDLAELIEKQGKNFQALQDANEALIKAKADGTSVEAIQASIEKINAEFLDMRKSVVEIEKKAGRPSTGGSKGEQKSEDQIAHEKAFKSYIRRGREEGLSELQQKAMNSGSDPDGGFLVLPEMDRTIDRFMPTISAMYRLADVRTIGSAKWEKMMKTSGMAMRRVADGATGGETTEPKYAKIAIEAHTAEVEPWVFNETLDDAFIDLEADLAEEAAIAFAEGAGSEFITGNGVGKARGIMSYTNVANASYAWGSVGYIPSGKSGAFASVAPSDKLITLQHSLKAQYRPGAVFLTNDTTLGVMRQMKDGSGSYYLWQPDPTGAFGGRFLGHTVEVDDNVADLGAGSLSLAFGNFKRGYTIVQRAGTTLIRDNITAKGTTKFNFRRRFGAGIRDYAAIKLMKFATS